MQNRYSGDIGDYIKLALLRELGKSHNVGVAWYLYPDESHNGDGGHTSYLANPGFWRPLDPWLFDHLSQVVHGNRSVRALEQAFGENTLFSSEPLPVPLRARERSDARSAWFLKLLENLSPCSLVFADPDNGLVSNDPLRRRASNFGKQLPLVEAQALSEGRCTVIYHHNSRLKGGHDTEVDKWLCALQMPAIAVRATAYSCRTFFIVNPDADTTNRAREFCCRWKDHKVRLHVSNVA